MTQLLEQRDFGSIAGLRNRALLGGVNRCQRFCIAASSFGQRVKFVVRNKRDAARTDVMNHIFREYPASDQRQQIRLCQTALLVIRKQVRTTADTKQCGKNRHSYLFKHEVSWIRPGGWSVVIFLRSVRSRPSAFPSLRGQRRRRSGHPADEV